MYINDKHGEAILEDLPQIPKHTLIVGESGSGKSMTAEAMLNFYHTNGYTIISLTDTKDKIELAYSMFPPKADYHLRFNKRYGIPTKSIPTKIYHPFTFLLPKKPIPKMNIYTIPLHQITRNTLNFIAESDQETTAIRILNQAISTLKPNEGIHHLLYYLEEKAEKKKGNLRSTSPDSFFTKGSEGGTQKTITDIISFFKPFLTNYFLTPNQHEQNINIQKIINDQQHYHIFTTKYLDDPKLKSLCINILIEQILKHAEKHAKHPICIFLEEMKFLTPDKPAGYTIYLSNTIRNFLSVSRNIGKGFASLSTTQEYFKLHTDIRNSINQLFIGKISSLQEIEKIGKSLRLRQAEIDKIKGLEMGEYLCNSIKDRDHYNEAFKTHLPYHRHAEIGYNIDQTIKKEKPELLQTHEPIIKIMQNTKTRIEESVQTIVKQQNQTLQEQATQKRKEKEEQRQQTQTKNITKNIKNQQKNKEQETQLAQQWLREYEEGQLLPNKTSYQSIANKYGTYKLNVMRKIKKAKEQKIKKQLQQPTS